MMKCSIVAPICSITEIEPVLEAGANEVYFGIMTKEWISNYGNADFVSRRQSESAHFSTYEDLSEIVHHANNHHCMATLTLNSHYSKHQLPSIFEMLEQWEARGGHSVMVADIEVLMWLNENGSKLKKQLSVMAGVFNSNSVAFFDRFHVSRIVLPREMRVQEMGKLVKNACKNIEYEAIVMFQKCEFIDSFCNFFHPCNEKHGCQMEFLCNGLKVNHVENNDFSTPFCAACSLDELSTAGIRHFKIAGRGYPVELIVNAVRFIRQIAETELKLPVDTKRQYTSVWGSDCCPKNCYYS